MSDRSGMSRREIVRIAAGDFALAASGLFLPDGLEETEAREDALGGARGGHYGQDHKGQHGHRTHGDKKDKGMDDRPPGAGLPPLLPWVAFRATGGYGNGNQPMHVNFYYRTLNHIGHRQ